MAAVCSLSTYSWKASGFGGYPLGCGPSNGNLTLPWKKGGLERTGIGSPKRGSVYLRNNLYISPLGSMKLSGHLTLPAVSRSLTYASGEFRRLVGGCQEAVQSLP